MSGRSHSVTMPTIKIETLLSLVTGQTNSSFNDDGDDEDKDDDDDDDDDVRIMAWKEAVAKGDDKTKRRKRIWWFKLLYRWRISWDPWIDDLIERISGVTARRRGVATPLYEKWSSAFSVIETVTPYEEAIAYKIPMAHVWKENKKRDTSARQLQKGKRWTKWLEPELFAVDHHAQIHLQSVGKNQPWDISSSARHCPVKSGRPCGNSVATYHGSGTPNYYFFGHCWSFHTSSSQIKRRHRTLVAVDR